MPIQLPKADEAPAPKRISTPDTPPPTPASANSLFAQPDVIPTTVQAQPAASRSTSIAEEHVPPPAAFSSGTSNTNCSLNGGVAEEIYANVQKVSDQPAETAAAVAAAVPPSVAAAAADAVVVDEPDENIYQNAQDLAECIDDTGMRAVALYDYEAAADDEISFDPDDMITHIEQVTTLKNEKSVIDLVT